MTTQNKVSIITAVGSSDFTIPLDFPQVVYLDIYGKHYKFSYDGSVEEEQK